MKLRPLQQIEALSPERQQQLADWVTTLTLAKTMELAREHFGVDIPQTTLHRYRQRCATADYLDKDEDSAQARAELIHAAASGQPRFAESTVHLLQKHAFELAHAPQEPEHRAALRDLFGLLASAHTSSHRDRLAQIQQDKLQFRREEFAWKQSLHAEKSGSDQSAVRNPHSAIAEDHLGPLATNFEGIAKRAQRRFPNNGVQSSSVPQDSPSLPVGPVPSPASLLDQRSSRGDEAHTPSAVPSASSPQFQMPNAQFSILNESPSPGIPGSKVRAANFRPRAAGVSPALEDDSSQPEEAHIPSPLPSAATIVENSAIQTPNSAIPTAPDHRAATVTERSDLTPNEPADPLVENSALVLTSPRVELDDPKNSAIQTPNSAIPLPYLHSEKNIAPSDSNSHLELRNSNLPLPPSADSLVEKSAQDAPPHVVETDNPPSDNSELRTPKSAIPPSSAVARHAIKRWRAHIPRPKNVPEPDGSWRQECPCGNPLPCAAHGDMPNRARCYKPQHPDYRFLLEQVGVPYYVPTAEELGCTPEALAQACDLFANNPRLTHPPDPRFNPFNKNGSPKPA